MHTAETTRVRFFMDRLIQLGRPVMLVGAAGSGKTVLMQDKLNNLVDTSDDWMVANVPFNFYTTSEMLQVRMDMRVGLCECIRVSVTSLFLVLEPACTRAVFFAYCTRCHQLFT